jgi:hypothetical protein
VFHKHLQHGKFLRAQLHRLCSDAHLTAGSVQSEITAAQDWSGRLLIGFCGFDAPQHCFDAGNQFTRVVRFGQVVICPQFKAEDPVNVLIPGSRHDHRHIVFSGAQRLANCKTIHHRQHHIQYYQGRLQAFNCLQTRLSITG